MIKMNRVIINSKYFLILSLLISNTVYLSDWISFGGRLQVDYLNVNEDNLPHQDGEEVRRARLFAKGKLGAKWKYKAHTILQAEGTGKTFSWRIQVLKTVFFK